jgi:hypothetical protein
MKPLVIALSGQGEGGKGRWRGHLTNVQCKTTQNCHNKSPLVQ